MLSSFSPIPEVKFLSKEMGLLWHKVLMVKRRESSLSSYLQSLALNKPENMLLQIHFDAVIYAITDSNLYGCRPT